MSDEEVRADPDDRPDPEAGKFYPDVVVKSYGGFGSPWSGAGGIKGYGVKKSVTFIPD